MKFTSASARLRPPRIFSGEGPPTLAVVRFRAPGSFRSAFHAGAVPRPDTVPCRRRSDGRASSLQRDRFRSLPSATGPSRQCRCRVGASGRQIVHGVVPEGKGGSRGAQLDSQGGSSTHPNLSCVVNVLYRYFLNADRPPGGPDPPDKSQRKVSGSWPLSQAPRRTAERHQSPWCDAQVVTRRPITVGPPGVRASG